MKKEKDNEEMKGCTFKPQINIIMMNGKPNNRYKDITSKDEIKCNNEEDIVTTEM